jgi:subtilisin
MIKKYFYFLILILPLILIACGDDELETAKTNGDDCIKANSAVSGQVIEGEYIVAVESPLASGRSQSISSVLSTHGMSDKSILKSFDGERSYHVVRMKDEDAMKLKNDSRVRHIEPDRIISACGCFTVVEPRSVTWNVDKVGYANGTGKTAWVIDTGIDADHPDLNVDKIRSKTFMETGTSFEDDNGHGTHIAGIIGALNNDIGTLGVASGATIVGLKVLDQNGDGKLSALINALTYVKANARSGDVVNISIGFPEVSNILENEIKAIASRGIYFSLAAGNESAEASTYSPARTSGANIYTVSAVDSLNTFASFSNYGNDVIDYAAPGVRILSTYKDGKYAILSGTSMAAPHVAGILLINNGKINSSGVTAVGDPDGVGDVIAHY